MLIEYKKENVITLPIVGKEKQIVENVMLRPGVNQVSTENWKSVEKLPKVKRLLDDKQIEILLKGDEDAEGFELSKVDVGQAAMVVKKTYDLILLEDWKTAENRPGVVKAINEQIRFIEEKTKPKAANG